MPKKSRREIDSAIVAARDDATRLLADLVRARTVNPPGEERAAAEVAMEFLDAHGIPYELHENQIESGDTILLLSDGLPELANNDQEMYGYDRIKNEFSSVGESQPQAIINHLKNSASAWVNGNDPDDDVTFVVIKAK